METSASFEARSAPSSHSTPGDSDRGASPPERRQRGCALCSLREEFQIADLRFQICHLRFAIYHPEGAAFAPPGSLLDRHSVVVSPRSMNNAGLVSYLRSSLHDLIVIPGKLAIASATRNPGESKLLDSRFRGNIHYHLRSSLTTKARPKGRGCRPQT
jgi:hypothetical protein